MCAEFSKLFEIAWKPFFPLRLLTNKDRKKKLRRKYAAGVCEGGDPEAVLSSGFGGFIT